MAKGGKKKEKTTRKCDSCENYEKEPVWGHTLCSWHRSCSGKDNWEPTTCVDCKKQKLDIKKLSGEEAVTFFREMYRMLEQTTKTYKQYKVDWEYEEVLKKFLNKTEIPARETTNSRDSVRSILNNTSNSEEINKQIHREKQRQEERERREEYEDENVQFVVRRKQDAKFQKGQPDEIQKGEDPEYGDILEMDHENDLEYETGEEYEDSDNYDEKEEEEYQDDTESTDEEREVPRRLISTSRKTKPIKRKLPVEKMFLDELGQHWIKFHPALHVVQGRDRMQIWTSKGTPISVKVRYNEEDRNLFMNLGPAAEDKDSPFINPREGYGVILQSFHKKMSGTTDLGTKVNGLISHIATDMGLAKVCDILKSNENHMTEMALEEKEKELLNSFPSNAFENQMVAEFAQGWNLSSETSYSDFAKDKNVDLEYLRKALNSYMNIRVDSAMLDKERICRKEMINCITSIHLLDLLGEKIELLTEKTKTDAQLSPSITKAIARTMLPTLKIAMAKWMLAKMRLRKAIFTDRRNPNVRTLLKTSLWEANIIPTGNINKLKRDGPDLDLTKVLNMYTVPYKRNFDEINTYEYGNQYQNKRGRFQRGRHFNTNSRNQQVDKQYRQYDQRQQNVGQSDTWQNPFQYNQQRGRRGNKQQEPRSASRSGQPRGRSRGRGYQNNNRDRQRSSKNFPNNGNTREKQSEGQNK